MTVDCTIVIGKFLDTGTTNTDYSEAGLFSALGRAYVEAIYVNWDVPDMEMSSYRRDQFWQTVADALR
jgi:hypothetical protein